MLMDFNIPIWLWWLQSGFSLGIAIYHLVLFFVTRERLYCSFALALLSWLLFFAFKQGFMTQIWPNHTNLHQVFLGLGVIGLCYFAKDFVTLTVDFGQYYPNIYKFPEFFSGLFLVFIFVSFTLPMATAEKIGTILLIVTCITALFVVVFCFPVLKKVLLFTTLIVAFALLTISQYLITSANDAFISYTLLIVTTSVSLTITILLAQYINQNREQHMVAQKLAIQNLEKYQTLYENALDGLFTVLIDGRLLEANPSLKKLLNLQLTEHSIVKQPFLHDHFAASENVWKKITQSLARHGTIEAFEILGRSDAWYSLSARHINVSNFELIEGSLIDITHRKRQQLQLAYLASHDPLTDLYNRTEFENHLQDAVHSQSTHTLLFIDLDQFKVINDTCGHAAGDECLRQIAEIFKQHTGPQDMLARLGGDEFGLLLWDQHQIKGKASAEQLRSALEANYFQWLQRIFKTSVSIGVTTLDYHINCGAQALSLADAACYEAKDAGRNRVVVNNPNKQTTVYRSSQMDMVATLTQALRDDQLVLVQQPIIALLTAPTALLRYEILVRLRTDNGLLNPGAFLPAAQRYNMLPQIDRWVFNRTCAWLAEDDNLARTDIVNINISPETLTDPAFIDCVLGCLTYYAIVPEKICFEITEYSAFNNFTKVLHHIHKLRDLGISFALDDFGSGFASFDHVKRLPVDFIKIDGQFIRGINQDSTDRTMVRAITDIAHTLGKKIIAEWVEDDETVDFLRLCGVDFGQGFHLGKPEALYSPNSATDTVALRKICMA